MELLAGNCVQFLPYRIQDTQLKNFETLKNPRKHLMYFAQIIRTLILDPKGD